MQLQRQSANDDNCSTARADVSMSTHSYGTEPEDGSVNTDSRQEINVAEVRTCLLHNSTINKNATNMWIDFEVTKYFTTEISASTETKDNVCRFALTTPTNTVARVRFVQQNCSQDNYIQVWVRFKRRRMPPKSYLDSRTGCENWTSPLIVDYFSLTNHVTFAIVARRWTTPFLASIHVTAETSKQPMLQQYQLTPYMGIYLFIRLSIHLLSPTHGYLSIYPFTYPSAISIHGYLNSHPYAVCLSVHPFMGICLSVFLSCFLSACPFIFFLSVYRSTDLFICGV